MLKLSPHQKVVLIAGPAGAGKTSMGKRIAKVAGWCHLPEDRVWDELPREPHTARTDAEKAIVQAKTLSYIKVELNRGNSVVLDFIVYETPPQPILFYQSQLIELGIPVYTKVLRPTVDEILKRQSVRANAHDTEVPLANRRKYAENEIRCLSTEYIDPSWVVDSSNLSVEDVYKNFFEQIVGLQNTE